MTDIKALEDIANGIRKQLVEEAVKRKAGHIASSLSCVDILVALWYDVMRTGEGPEKDDKLILSKGHGCYGLNIIRGEWHNMEPGFGSLGHGLPVAVGMAWAAKIRKLPYRVFCIVGDGEMQEGSCYEAMQVAPIKTLKNLTVIVDANGFQAMGPTLKIMETTGATFEELGQNFLWLVTNRVCGHNMRHLIESLRKKHPVSPVLTVADTIKGYGLKCMENVAKFHYRVPTEEELAQGNRYE